MLRATHAPDQGAGTVFSQRAGDPLELRARDASHPLDFRRVPFLHFVPDLIHAPDTGPDVVLVFPAILENVVENAPDQRHIGSRPEPHELIGVGRGAGKARIANDHRRVVFFLGLEKMQQ